MLVLHRRLDESLHLFPALGLDPNLTVAELFAGGHIQIRILEVQGNGVRLGIAAPAGITVLRGELLPRQVSPDPSNHVATALMAQAGRELAGQTLKEITTEGEGWRITSACVPCSTSWRA